MWIVLLVFIGVPLAYTALYGITPVQASLYGVTVGSLLLGYVAVRSLCQAAPLLLLRSEPLPREALLRRLTLMMLVCMLFSAVLAVKAMQELGDDYRLLFFVEQKDIFGYERFGFFLQIFTEFGAIVLFALALTLGRSYRWRLYLLAWAVLGTLITLGRWYAFYAVLLLLLSSRKSGAGRSSGRYVAYGIGALACALGGALLFVCRGGECDVSADLLLHGLTAGISNYLFVPIDMVHAYQTNQGFGPGLLIGFAVYPFEFLGRLSGLYTFVYEYDKWALLVQDYVELPNVGLYNALVGQPLTSLVALGYPAVFLHYVVLGGLMGVSYHNASVRHPLATVSAVAAVTSFFVPALSGPMWLCLLMFWVALLPMSMAPWRTGGGGLRQARRLSDPIHARAADDHSLQPR